VVVVDGAVVDGTVVDVVMVDGTVVDVVVVDVVVVDGTVVDGTVVVSGTYWTSTEPSASIGGRQLLATTITSAAIAVVTRVRDRLMGPECTSGVYVAGVRWSPLGHGGWSRRVRIDDGR
jgi:hypothetical protein